jgi:hypothetical protein
MVNRQDIQTRFTLQHCVQTYEIGLEQFTTSFLEFKVSSPSPYLASNKSMIQCQAPLVPGQTKEITFAPHHNLLRALLTLTQHASWLLAHQHRVLSPSQGSLIPIIAFKLHNSLRTRHRAKPYNG